MNEPKIKNSEPKIEITADGTHTLMHHIYGDSFHSLNGAETESQHIFIERGFNYFNLPALRILEVGFGTGLNALLTLEAAKSKNCRVDYTAIELYPIEVDTAQKLCFAERPGFIELHKAPFSETVQVSTLFNLKKLHADLLTVKFDHIFDLVYFDAFAPDTQPELWSKEVFAKICDAMVEGGVLVTYSVKGEVKRRLRSLGFVVERLEGPPGKRHILRAIKSKTCGRMQEAEGMEKRERGDNEN